MTETPVRALPPDTAHLVEQVVIGGDLAKLSVEERLHYYQAVCASLGLNPLTKPFEYITLNGKLTLYAKRDATDQLRRLHNVSVAITARERLEDVYVVTARATMPDGRTDESTGAVSLGKLSGEALANSFMRCETKAKRRVTLSICGLGLLDETEVDTIPPDTARTAPPPARETVLDEATEALHHLSGLRKTSGKTLIKQWADETGVTVRDFNVLTGSQLTSLRDWAREQASASPAIAETVDMEF